MSWSDRIREAIDKKGISLTELGRQAGVGRVTLSRWYNGHQILSWANLESVCSVLRLTLPPSRNS